MDSISSLYAQTTFLDQLAIPILNVLINLVGKICFIPRKASPFLWLVIPSFKKRYPP